MYAPRSQTRILLFLFQQERRQATQQQKNERQTDNQVAREQCAGKNARQRQRRREEETHSQSCKRWVSRFESPVSASTALRLSHAEIVLAAVALPHVVMCGAGCDGTET
ncbi:hypothetical protein BS50DRAFT_96513 [Corynespora cassiicola Philippines]|uniref:Uncharacterized protein n=1 Tax=Corynespora cassiicola Philippines TaxID=1448308 RepID=A0A2T2NF40_CORCC|nr:hypothetical protein BS50DRAFT_96513 [Corynespora cassiicola Philippines]